MTDANGWRNGARPRNPLARRTNTGVWLSQLLGMQALTFADIDACIISSVVPQSLFNLRNLARRYLKVEPLVIGENAALGVEIRIEKPSEAGADRW